MATKINQSDIKQINQLYYQCHNYSQVAREMGISPSTVKKYVQVNYKPVDESKIKHIAIADVPRTFNAEIFHKIADIDILCLTDEEKKEMNYMKEWEIEI